MKIAGRVLVFVLGLSLLFFAWRKAHHDPAAATTPTGGNGSSAPAVLVVFGGFLALMAFLPSSSTLSRWTATTPPKRPRATRPAHFRRKRRG